MNKAKRATGKRFLALRGLVALSFGALCLLPTLGCQATISNTNPVGERFPVVSGESLAGESVQIPLAEPAVYLVGYIQKAQFDADRWLLGILQAGLEVPVYEVPTLKGLFPRMLGDRIDNGMRSGIPEGDWQSVVTLYGDDADQVARFTGTETGRNMRVLLVDENGIVIWFHDSGYSARVLLELKERAQGLVKP